MTKTEKHLKELIFFAGNASTDSMGMEWGDRILVGQMSAALRVMEKLLVAHRDWRGLYTDGGRIKDWLDSSYQAETAIKEWGETL